MKGKTARCDWKSVPQRQPSPCDRYKHACVICRGFVYLYGGRNTTALRDFWRYNIEKNEWEMLDCSRDAPEELEEHSMVAYKGTLYIFGGMVDSAFTQAKTPLWIYDTDAARWTERPKVPAETESSAPSNRKGHSAVAYHSRMYIYGGYVGIRGISQEFWTFHFGMYLFGGLMGLSERKDLWKWDFVSSSWSHIRTSQGPPPVVGHASVAFKDSMLIFGGGMPNSSPNGDLWKYHFHTHTWKKLSSTTEANFSPKMYHCILGTGAHFQTTSDFTPAFPSRWKSQRKDPPRLVTVPKHARFGSYFRQQPAYGALGSEESNAIEMNTFSLPLEPGGFRAFQTTAGAELDPNRATGTVSEDKPSPLLVTLQREAPAAAQAVGEEGADRRHAAAEGGGSSGTNLLLLIGGKPLSSFSEISFWQMEFDSL